ncbi:MAG: AMP-binding protein [Coriobacteriia bacterium]|nr:AMP-binding protein [Coriobacteriia bacterium]
MPITETLIQNAKLYGDMLCLTEVNPEKEQGRPWKELALVETAHSFRYQKELTWRSFNERANQFANMLLARGVTREDKIGILLMNCIEWLPIYFGVMKTGAVVVPLNFRYSSDEIEYTLGLAEITTLVIGPEFVERVRAIKDNTPAVSTYFFVGDECPDFAESFEVAIADCSNEEPGIELSDDLDAAIYFSSGTTGFPKAILHKHLSFVTSCLVEQNHHSQTHDDVFVCIPPLYHTGAKMHWFGSFLVGGRSVLLRGIRPKWIIETIAREKASIVWLLVPWAQDILDAIESGEINLDDYDLSAWRLMHIGAQPVPPSLIRRWLKYFPHHEYDTNYGLSESCGPGAVHLGVENIHKVGAIGKAGFSWATRIVDEQGVDVKRGDVGELLVRGNCVMECYYHDPEATAETLKDGWLYTGDMAMEDEDGFIYLVDRKKDVIITGGENIYPVQIEDFLRGFEKIKDVAVIGLADHRLGEIAAAIIEIKPDVECSEDEIMQFCLQLPRYKRPHRIIFAPVPRNATGKIEKPRLRLKYAGESIVKQQFEIED